MGRVVAALLPLAVVVAVSPVPLITVILLMLADRAAGSSAGFLVGWALGIAGATIASLLVVEGTDAGTSGRSAASWVAVILGMLLLGLATRRWRSRPRSGERPELPSWVGAIDRVTAPRACGLGLLLVAVSPKNLPVCVAAGATIAGSGLSDAQRTLSVAAFTLAAASTVAVPVFAHALLGKRIAGPLESLRRWLTAHSAPVTALLLLVIGAVLIAQGLGGLA
jgi:hypothetical protein